MSAILKALRRVEQESGGQVRGPSASENLDAKKALSQRAKKTWVLSRVSFAFGTVLIVAAGLALGFVYGPWFSGSHPPVRLPEPGQGESTLPSPGPENLNERPERPKPPKPLSPLSRGAPGKPPGGMAPDATRPERPGGSPPAARSATVTPPPMAVAQTETEASPGLELQAIVWSDDPESRFAVINGHIVRADGMVEGVKVTSITPSTVSLKLGDKAWTLRMLGGD